MADDVFKEAPFWGDFSHDPGNLGPEVAGIIFPFAVARERERLRKRTSLLVVSRVFRRFEPHPV